ALSSGSHTWNPALTAGLTSGAEYFVCAQVFVTGLASPVDEEISRWPVVVDTAYTGAKPTFQLDKSTVRLAGVYRAATSPILSSKTPDEVVRITQSGAGSVSWTISVVDSNGNPANWLSVTPTSGTGPGTFTIGLSDDHTAMPRCTPVDGNVATVTLTSSALGNSPRHVQVLATIYPGADVAPPPGCPHPSGVTSAPFGQVDTPVQNVTGVQGAIGVTGWVLDDIGVSDVRIYRNCMPFDGAGACNPVAGQNMVFIGTAAFLAGARPDVEETFPTRPLAYRAGWGYLMLTNMLPDVTNGFPYGGQGPLTLYAVARDADGRMTLLGRTQADSTPTNITMSNATIAKPFGAIDTPDQGQTVSGLLANFGWALTRDSDNAAGAGDILVPTDGSTMGVFLDGAHVGQVTYNQCRGSVGPSLPAGSFCDDDVANIFGNATPQPSGTLRLANVTPYRNLDDGRAAIGSFAIDTTALSNGLHTIAWGVTDSAGRAEGIGSRFFLVSNSAADAVASVGDAASSDPAPPSLDDPLRRAPAMVLRPAADVAGLPLDGDAVWGRSTFDIRRDWEAVEPGPGGRRDVRIPELGRLELFLGDEASAGYLVVKDGLRPLPPGSQLRDGHFTWAPGAGYIGDYNLVFLRGGAQLPVTVKIHPASEAGGIQAYIDLPAQGESVRGRFRVAGWAADSLAWAGAGIGAVHVWALPKGSERAGASPEAVFLGAAEVGGMRPDVGTTVGPQFERAGWNLETDALAPGMYDIVAYFWSTRTGRFEDARTVMVTVR
ncbi:MAG: hypothetical protein Q7V01_15530, partial [Vicinamibacterales bacterium]|nr:hypothetical protein [Vicinamibacterales bacterium]